jgi:hypothetical protein
MTIKVKAEGLVIPKELLDGAEEFEVSRRDGVGLIVVPKSDEDPIWRWGQDPVDGGEPDASENLDRHLYGSGS